MNIEDIKKRGEEDIASVGNQEQWDKIYKKYFGKEGELSLFLRSLKDAAPEEKAKLGKEANEAKNFLTELFEKQKSKIKGGGARSAKDKIDVTAPGKKPQLGALHLLTQTRRRVEKIFQIMGFEIMEGPEVENAWYNFDALNVPKDHPARDRWDTFWMKNGQLLRTHTSPVQIRYMEKNNPPLRMVVFGNVFRHEATDVSHEFQLYQVEGLMVDKKISVANLKAAIGEFLRRFFEKDVEFILRPDFFPFTEPSFDVGIKCLICKGKGCSACKKSGWIEVAGAGMVHPNVFKNAGLVPKDWQGWAFGFGLERLIMLKYKISDIRILRSGDLRFLKQF